MGSSLTASLNGPPSPPQVLLRRLGAEGEAQVVERLRVGVVRFDGPLEHLNGIPGAPFPKGVDPALNEVRRRLASGVRGHQHEHNKEEIKSSHGRESYGSRTLRRTSAARSL